jgi:hypothetical protein
MKTIRQFTTATVSVEQGKHADYEIRIVLPLQEIGLEQSALTLKNGKVVLANNLLLILHMEKTGEQSFSYSGFNLYPTL